MLVIHIGAPKTGTTSLQHFLAENAAALEAHGVLYPEVGLSHRGKHHALKSELRASSGSGGTHWAALRELRKERPDQHILVSEESFYYLDPANLVRLRELAGPGEVMILVYFRDYASHVASLYAQGTKAARGLDEGEALGTKAGNAMLDFDAFFVRYMAKPSHFEIISRWADIFGWAAIRVRPFHRESLVGGDIVADLLSVLGVSLAELGLTPKQEVNVAPGWKSLEMLRALWLEFDKLPGATVDGRISPHIRNLCRETIEAAVSQDERAQYLSLAQRGICAEATVRDAAALQARLSPPGFAYPELSIDTERPFLPSIEQINASELIPALARLAVRLAGEVPRAERQGKSERQGKADRPDKAERKEARAARRSGAGTGSGLAPRP
jgi:hypothetical protein